jgi:hypothetical protein
MLDEHLKFLCPFNQITLPLPIDADWHMPVQTCSFLFRRQIWQRCPYPAEYRVVGDHIWFRRQMRLGLKLVSIRKPIGLFACTRMTSPNASNARRQALVPPETPSERWLNFSFQNLF